MIPAEPASKIKKDPMLYIRLLCSGTSKVHREARERMQVHPCKSFKIFSSDVK